MHLDHLLLALYVMLKGVLLGLFFISIQESFRLQGGRARILVGAAVDQQDRHFDLIGMEEGRDVGVNPVASQNVRSSTIPRYPLAG